MTGTASTYYKCDNCMVCFMLHTNVPAQCWALNRNALFYLMTPVKVGVLIIGRANFCPVKVLVLQPSSRT